MSLILNPLFYINGKPHIGHHYTLSLSTSYSLLRLIQGRNPTNVSGTDENGGKVFREYEEHRKTEEITLGEYKAKYREIFNRELFAKHNAIVHYSTSALYHHRLINSNIRKLFKAGKIYKGTYQGFYDIKYESYVDSQYVSKLDDDYKRKYVIEKSEAGYFYKIDEKNKNYLLNSLSNYVPSDTYHNLITKYIDNSDDLFITRKEYNNSIILDVDKEKYGIYVWFEAIQYYTYYFRNFPYSECHIVIGKDITLFHTVLLGSLCLDIMGYIPYKLIIHPMIISKDEKKLGKSENNTSESEELINEENFRFTMSYLVGKPLSKDFSVSLDSVKAHKAFITNNIGNLISRYFTLYKSHFRELVVEDYYDLYTNSEIKYLYELVSKIDIYSNILDILIDLSNRANKMISENNLWEDTRNKAAVMYTVGEYVLKIMLLYMTIDHKSLEFVMQFYSTSSIMGALYTVNSLLCTNISDNIKNIKLI